MPSHFKPNEEKQVLINEHDYAILIEALGHMEEVYRDARNQASNEMDRLDAIEKMNYADHVKTKLWHQVRPK
jgi:hypothetical protein